jgi:hypothetical protein
MMPICVSDDWGLPIFPLKCMMQMLIKEPAPVFNQDKRNTNSSGMHDPSQVQHIHWPAAPHPTFRTSRNVLTRYLGKRV